MTVNKLKAIVHAENERLLAELKEMMETQTKTAYEVLAENPFFAGQVHLMNNLTREAMKQEL